jgi:hypothetical protein
MAPEEKDKRTFDIDSLEASDIKILISRLLISCASLLQIKSCLATGAGGAEAYVVVYWHVSR